MKKYRYLALYFAIILVIFTQFSSKNIEKQIEKSKDIIDEISEDKTLSLKEKKEMLQILRQEEINNNTKAKPKQNLKT